ncbi:MULTISPECIES: sarcosine oxidase subunit gamma [unclassified Sphingomonas]|uniref:sarcosine oxidase subunit gamma n=1 Tax=unclassified Sphingomonas TaxID=196159 RepID=UPI00215172F7|nr:MULTISPECIES: hypothetical protein [unclassified Sphingomonas]MCR5872626.1 hypothetical protein [Sphingomonas sp. J344]UUX99090.1 hypothetical protein LRS08_16605 [Sphingomonas sp. J315]
MSDPILPAWCRIDRALTLVKIQIRDAPDAEARLAALFGVPAPARNCFSARDSVALASIAPGEWLLTDSSGEAGPHLSRIQATMCDQTALCLDLTHGVIAFRLNGPAATACLAAYTALDLRDAAMTTGSALRTRFGDIGIFLVRTDDSPTYLLIADQSYAPYLLELIARSDWKAQ